MGVKSKTNSNIIQHLDRPSSEDDGIVPLDFIGIFASGCRIRHA